MPITVAYCTLRRTFRMGACPILEVTVSYPCLGDEDARKQMPPPGIARFNEAYAGMAEAFLQWVEGTLLETARHAFREAGPGAGYSFDRRTVDCRMTAAFAGEPPERLYVRRYLRVGSRRGECVERARTETDVWRCPGLTLRHIRKDGELLP